MVFDRQQYWTAHFAEHLNPLFFQRYYNLQLVLLLIIMQELKIIFLHKKPSFSKLNVSKAKMFPNNNVMMLKVTLKIIIVQKLHELQ